MGLIHSIKCHKNKQNPKMIINYNYFNCYYYSQYCCYYFYLFIFIIILTTIVAAGVVVITGLY